MSENGSGEHEAFDPDVFERKTLSPGEIEADSMEEQSRLIGQLADDPNPHVRLIVHMAQRQLDMAELLIAVRNDIAELKRLMVS